MNKKILALFAAAVLLFTVGCGTNTEPEENKENEQVQTEVGNDVYSEKVLFTIEMEDGGVMKGEVYPNLAPDTVSNFIALAEDGFYDGLIFHRVIPGFMIQGGGYDKNMEEKHADTIKGEFASNDFENELKHTRGVLSMARTPDPDSASSQFFIMHADSPSLDGEYAAFGKVTEGLDIIDEIANVETTIYGGVMKNFPTEPQIIKSITIEK